MSGIADNDYIQKAVDRYSDTILRVAFQYTRSRHDAEDIMQDVFISMLKQPSEFESDSHLKAWLIRVTINKSKDFVKSSKRKTVELLDIYSYNFEPEEASILTMMQKLSPFDRNIIYLFYFENYSAKEIADILKVKEGLVFVRMSRARQKLKILLENQEI